jgi:hypothetical protein
MPGFRSARRLWPYGLVLLVVVVLFGVLGRGRLGFLPANSAKPTVAAATAATTPPTTTPTTAATTAMTTAPAPGTKHGPKRRAAATTTTTFLKLQARGFRRGDCVTYDQTPGREAETMKVVSCALPHLLEVSGGLDLGDRFDHYPTKDEWGAVLDHECGQSVAALLGAPRDPAGRFIPSAVFATKEGWERGDHTAWCGVIEAPQAPPPSDGHREPFTGKAEGVPQARLVPVGSCWRNNDASAVPCTEPHDYEVSGRVDLSGRTRPPPEVTDNAAWNKIVGADCQRLARKYVAHGFAPKRVGWSPISKESWAAGSRIVECTVVS